MAVRKYNGDRYRNWIVIASYSFYFCRMGRVHYFDDLMACFNFGAFENINDAKVIRRLKDRIKVWVEEISSLEKGDLEFCGKNNKGLEPQIGFALQSDIFRIYGQIDTTDCSVRSRNNTMKRVIKTVWDDAVQNAPHKLERAQSFQLDGAKGLSRGQIRRLRDNCEVKFPPLTSPVIELSDLAVARHFPKNGYDRDGQPIFVMDDDEELITKNNCEIIPTNHLFGAMNCIPHLSNTTPPEQQFQMHLDRISPLMNLHEFLHKIDAINQTSPNPINQEQAVAIFTSLSPSRDSGVPYGFALDILNGLQNLHVIRFDSVFGTEDTEVQAAATESVEIDEDLDRVECDFACLDQCVDFDYEMCDN
jgi:hypothetical protein